MKTAFAAFCIGFAIAAPALAADLRLSAGDMEREAKLHRPRAAPPGPLPLVIVLHGAMGSGSQAEESYGWNELADTQGFMVAYPDGEKRSWNAGGGCCGPAWDNAHVDVGFLDALIGEMTDSGQADPARIYLAGISNGAAMAYRYACEGAHPIAAIGAVAGAMTLDCPSPPPVSLMAIHGMQDRTIPYAGGPGRRSRIVDIQWPATEATLRAFRSANDCGEGAEAARGGVAVTRWDCARGRQVSLITIADAGHQWPGSKSARRLASRILDLDPPSRALDATAALWGFFDSVD